METTTEQADDVQEQARQVYRQSLVAEMPMTGRQLGAMFERSERWGRNRKAEIDRLAGAGTAADRAPENGSVPLESAAEQTAEVPAVTAAAAPSAAPAAPSAAHAVANEDVPRHAAEDTSAVPADQPAHPRQPDESLANGATEPAAAQRQPDAAAAADKGARVASWAGFLFGTVISVAANVLHAWLPLISPSPERAVPAGWTPGLAPQIGAAVWPLALLISVEVLTRVPWPNELRWNLARYGGAGIVALGAAVISYGHLNNVLEAWHYTTAGAFMGPLVIDGLMVISGFALLALSAERKTETTVDE